MGKDMIIEILKLQLEAANATILSMSEEMKSIRRSFEATISELQKTIANLESLLKERDESLGKAKAQMRGLKATCLPKKSEKQTTTAEPKSDEQKAAEESARQAAIKARGNNGAKRKDYFTVKTVEEDIYPRGINVAESSLIDVREVIRYEMIRPSFIKHVYHIHILKKDGVIYSGATPLSPLLNSRFDGSFIAGIAELRYLYSMPVERIVKYFQGNGFDIDKQTAHGLLAKTADLFDKLYEAMGKAVKEGRYLHCDETYHTVLVKDNSKGSKKGYIWVIVNAQAGLSYFFYDDRVCGSGFFISMQLRER